MANAGGNNFAWRKGDWGCIDLDDSVYDRECLTLFSIIACSYRLAKNPPEQVDFALNTNIILLSEISE